MPADCSEIGELQEILRQGIASRTFPGAVVSVGVGPAVRQQESAGGLTYTAGASAVGPDSLWDCASLTKVVATTTAVMLLEEAGKLDLDSLVASPDYCCPEFAQNGKGGVTIRQLLTHTSGLPAFREYEKEGVSTRQGVIGAIMSACHSDHWRTSGPSAPTCAVPER